jgi:hypothetical protein
MLVTIAVAGVIAPVSKGSAGTTLYDNWSGIGDDGFAVNAGGEAAASIRPARKLRR